MERLVPFVDLQGMMQAHGAELQSALQEVLRSGRFVNGPRVHELEERLAQRVGVGHAVACGSGTAAQQLLLMALGVGPGDEVLLPDFTFVATAEAVALVGATPVCVDVDPESFNMDADAARRALSRRVKAIVGVSLFGSPAGFDALESLAQSEGLPLVEDACQSFGARLGDRPSCAFGTAAFTSFYPSKPLGGLGDGGMVFTRNPDLAQRVRLVAQHGQVGAHEHLYLGFNSRLDEFQAAALLVQERFFEEAVQRRRERARCYDAALAGFVRVPQLAPGCRSTYAQYTVRLADGTARDDLVSYLAALGVPTAIHYPRPLHAQPSLQPYLRRRLPTPVTEELCARVISLPLSAYMTAEDQDRVIQAVQSWATVGDAAAAGG